MSLRAEGHWVDAVIPCSADGYPAPFFYALHEYPRIRDDGRYFRLMGRISPSGKEPESDDPTLTFRIGTVLTGWRAPASGRLFVFANDKLGFYWNNWGAVRLTITAGEAASA